MNLVRNNINLLLVYQRELYHYCQAASHFGNPVHPIWKPEQIRKSLRNSLEIRKSLRNSLEICRKSQESLKVTNLVRNNNNLLFVHQRTLSLLSRGISLRKSRIPYLEIRKHVRKSLRKSLEILEEFFGNLEILKKFFGSLEICRKS